jgi:alpha-beta hydrolase superfamily lysophospholipase
MHAETYRTHLYWQRYQDFFPPQARITAANAPAEERFAWRGASLHVDRFASTQAALTVIVMHGGGGYGRLFAPLAQLLHSAGHEVIAPDLPGYGLTQAASELISYHAWVDALCDLARSEHARNGRPVVLFGGSLGGYLAYLCAARLGRGIIAGVIATTLADPRMPVVQQQFARNALVQHLLLPLLPLLTPLCGRLRLPVKWFTRMHAMSRNRALNRLVAADPYGGSARVPVSFMHSIFTVRPDLEPEQFDICPLMLAQPASDNWTGLACSQSFFDRIKGDKRLVMLDNCGHFPVEQPGVTQLQEAALQFLREVTPAPATGSTSQQAD